MVEVAVATLARLGDEHRVRHVRTRHRDHVRRPLTDDAIGHPEIKDAADNEHLGAVAVDRRARGGVTRALEGRRDAARGGCARALDRTAERRLLAHERFQRALVQQNRPLVLEHIDSPLAWIEWPVDHPQAGAMPVKVLQRIVEWLV